MSDLSTISVLLQFIKKPLKLNPFSVTGRKWVDSSQHFCLDIKPPWLTIWPSALSFYFILNTSADKYASISSLLSYTSDKPIRFSLYPHNAAVCEEFSKLDNNKVFKMGHKE